MPRARAIFPVALSVESAAKALKVPSRFIRDAIYLHGTLPAYRPGTNSMTRVRVRDLEEWIERTWTRAKIKRKIKQVSP
jgi:excisionase family DNA binding protein